MDTQITAVLLLTLVASSFSVAHAQQFPANTLTTERSAENILPTAAGTVLDEFPFDGFPNAFDRQFTVVNLTSVDPLSEALSDRRAVVEFDLSSLAGRNIRRAVLKLRPSVIGVPEGSFVVPIEVRRYQGNGVLNLGDFHRGSFATAFDMRSIRIDSPTTINLTQSVRHALSQQWTYLGFTLRTNVQFGVSFGVLESANPPPLVVTFD